jgi:hypothetical protein
MRFQSALYQPVRLRTSSECRPGSLGTVPFAGVGPVPAGTGRNQQSVDSTGLCQPVPAGTGGKGNARIMPALYDHIRWCIPKIFTILVDRKSVGYRCWCSRAPDFRCHGVQSGPIRSLSALPFVLTFWQMDVTTGAERRLLTPTIS